MQVRSRDHDVWRRDLLSLEWRCNKLKHNVRTNIKRLLNTVIPIEGLFGVDRLLQLFRGIVGQSAEVGLSEILVIHFSLLNRWLWLDFAV